MLYGKSIILYEEMLDVYFKSDDCYIVVPIDQNVLKLDIGITDEETREFFINYGMEASGLKVQFELFGKD